MKVLGLFALRHYKKILTLLGFLLLWQLAVKTFHIKEFILPSPVKVFGYLVLPQLASKYHWPRHIGTTLMEMLISFSVTAFLGIFVAILITWSNFLRRVITPIMALFNSLPKIALAPLFLLWFGFGIIPNIMIAVLIAFFPVAINTATGLSAVDEDLLDLVRYLNASQWQVFLKIRLPNSCRTFFQDSRSAPPSVWSGPSWASSWRRPRAWVISSRAVRAPWTRRPCLRASF
jgi:NitT/TauT family transport system permease protein